ncbi:GNAT family N-acetyltransferase [Geotalea sp. SG265]|uniref:GNAT family N-acetyltransferase n=1 Tax=Geotalea sp. SG265 TaxID=2922867 RepID=UPI001FAF69EF|nr:GNAT family N-acetyltransferase [Geotalea sp. SG265]
MALRVRRYTPDDEDALFAFRETIFPKGHKSLDRPHFRWKFLKHPYAVELPFFIMEDDGRVVGTQGYWPFYLRVGNKRMTCGHLVDFNVKDPYRGLPTLRLFKAVSACSQLNFGAYISQDAQRFFTAANWVDMSSNLKNYYMYLRAPGKAGITRKGKFFCQYLWNNVRHKKLSKLARLYEFKVDLRLPHDLEQLISLDAEKNQLNFIKQRKFLAWRYEESEINKYRFASIHVNGKLKCTIVFNVLKDIEVNRCFIMDIFHLPGDELSIRILLFKLIAYLRQYRDIITIQTAALPLLGEVFRDFGFRCYQSPIGFMCSKNYAGILNESNPPWKFNFNLGDTDFL